MVAISTGVSSPRLQWTFNAWRSVIAGSSRINRARSMRRIDSASGRLLTPHRPEPCPPIFSAPDFYEINWETPPCRQTQNQAAVLAGSSSHLEAKARYYSRRPLPPQLVVLLPKPPHHIVQHLPRVRRLLARLGDRVHAVGPPGDSIMPRGHWRAAATHANLEEEERHLPTRR